MAQDRDSNTSLEQEELRGISRTIAEIEWLLLVVVLLYTAFGGPQVEDRPAIAVALIVYATSILIFHFTNFYKLPSRWKIALEIWGMMIFITWSLWFTGRLESPLLNTYLLVIISSSLTLGKITTFAELCLIAACFVFLGDHSTLHDLYSLPYLGAIAAQFVPFVLVAYITTMFSSDIRYGLNRAKQISEMDELTELLNRRGFAMMGGRLFGQAVRYNRPLSVLMLDSDNLKQVNDSFGHQAGDGLLKLLARSTQSQLRNSDVLARYGGDEFVILLPETPASGAQGVAEKIREAVMNTELMANGKIVKTTVSVGAASYPNDGHTLDALVAKADMSMYKAKQSGRIQLGISPG